MALRPTRRLPATSSRSRKLSRPCRSSLATAHNKGISRVPCDTSRGSLICASEQPTPGKLRFPRLQSAGSHSSARSLRQPCHRGAWVVPESRYRENSGFLIVPGFLIYLLLTGWALTFTISPRLWLDCTDTRPWEKVFGLKNNGYITQRSRLSVAVASQH